MGDTAVVQALHRGDATAALEKVYGYITAEDPKAEDWVISEWESVMYPLDKAKYLPEDFPFIVVTDTHENFPGSFSVSTGEGGVSTLDVLQTRWGDHIPVVEVFPSGQINWASYHQDARKVLDKMVKVWEMSGTRWPLSDRVSVEESVEPFVLPSIELPWHLLRPMRAKNGCTEVMPWKEIARAYAQEKYKEAIPDFMVTQAALAAGAVYASCSEFELSRSIILWMVEVYVLGKRGGAQ